MEKTSHHVSMEDGSSDDSSLSNADVHEYLSKLPSEDAADLEMYLKFLNEVLKDTALTNRRTNQSKLRLL